MDLTARQRKLLNLIAQGRDNTQIAAVLGVLGLGGDCGPQGRGRLLAANLPSLTDGSFPAG